MGAAHTLRRHLIKRQVTLPDGQAVFADIDRKRPEKKGTPFRRVVIEMQPTVSHPYEHAFHATKGARRVRVAV